MYNIFYFKSFFIKTKYKKNLHCIFFVFLYFLMELLLDSAKTKSPNTIMSRVSRYPTLIYFGLILVICILGYKHWKLITFTSELKEQVIAHEEKVNQFTFEKSTLEKDKELCLGRNKFYEERVEQNQLALTKKDEEINELNKRFKDGALSLEQYKIEYDSKLVSSIPPHCQPPSWRGFVLF